MNRNIQDKIVKDKKPFNIRPITLKVANEYVADNHRHHNGTVGCKFAIGLFVEEKMVGCAICGRPVSRYLDNGLTLEINRVCTDGTYNACSKLYGACCRIAKEMGYKRVITYTLESENGSSLKASGFICEGKAGGKMWNGSRRKDNGVPPEYKNRWAKYFK